MILATIIRSLISILLLQILAKIAGPKQISQLSFYDYIVGITIGSIAAVLAIDDQVEWYLCAIAMLLYTSVSIFFSWLTTKSIKAREHLTGTPHILIFHGKIIEKNLKKIHFDVNDLLTQCRIAGYFDISQIAFAIMETTGEVSFLAMSESKPVTIKDMNKKVVQEELMANVIIDGKIMDKNLKAIGKDQYWLLDKISEQDCKIEDILLAIANRNNAIYLYKKDEQMKQQHYFL
ncbi:MAG: DUF421 domain-containing protein [Erysipelotrichia bacterium]|nr:DUF421 domain-containing protein [Erysipelotrichia bacterium]NCC54323.1 DUF421 domain-containing protein [Erysipelotrichia bacterium]